MEFISNLLAEPWFFWTAVAVCYLVGLLNSGGFPEDSTSGWPSFLAYACNVCLLFLFLHHFNVTPQFVLARVSEFGVCFVVYLGIGSAWSMFKWLQLVLRQRRAFVDLSLKWCNQNYVEWADVRTSNFAACSRSEDPDMRTEHAESFAYRYRDFL